MKYGKYLLPFPELWFSLDVALWTISKIRRKSLQLRFMTLAGDKQMTFIM